MLSKEQFENYVEQLKSLSWNDMCNGADVEIPKPTGGTENFMNLLYFENTYSDDDTNILVGFKQVHNVITSCDMDDEIISRTIIWQTPWNEYYCFEIDATNDGTFMLDTCYKVIPEQVMVTKYKKIVN